jgi:cytochrome P450
MAILLSSLLEPLNFLIASAIALFSTAVYRLYFHPLSHIPGPFLARLSSLYLYRLSYIGTEASSIDALHKIYGPIVRIAPNDVDISDGAALNQIYVRNGGFLKNPCYQNFDIDEFPTIFSALEPAHRTVRAKAVVGMFAPGAVREGKDVIYGCVERMVDKLEKEKAAASGKPVNVLNIFRSLALDAVTAFLFDKPYNGIEEQRLSASEFVDTFVAVGRFFYLPNWLFKLVEFWSERTQEGKQQVWKSIAKVDKFVSTLVDETKVDEHEPGKTYQARLLNAGISRAETISQCKDLMFAGTDSTGMNLATISWYLVRNPEKYVQYKV